MKKSLFSAILTIFVLLAFSCQSTTESTTDTPATITEVTDETFHRIYDRYSETIILDGASRHTVVSGDTLSRISSNVYGDPLYYPLIMLASRDTVVDPDKIQPGMELIIPDLKRNLSIPGARSAVKGVILDCVPIERERRGDESANHMKALSDNL